MRQVEEKYLMTRQLKICETCEWCVENGEFPKCLRKNEQVGLFEYCEQHKWKTGNHYTM